MTKWQWAALWKMTAKKYRWLYHLARDMQWDWKLRYRRKFGWARAWKRAAKNYRAMFRLCALMSVPLWRERYWAAQRSAKAWKAAAKKWRMKALLLRLDRRDYIK